MATDNFTESFTALRQKLHMMACRMLRDDADAQDAVQDAFCNLWAAGATEGGDVARYRLYAVLRNVCINRLRRRRTEPAEGQYAATVPPVEPDEFETLRPALLATLSPMQRRVFEMAVFDDMEYDTIAIRLGIDIGAVRTNMCRARQKVRQQYALIKYK